MEFSASFKMVAADSLPATSHVYPSVRSKFLGGGRGGGWGGGSSEGCLKWGGGGGGH